MKQAIVYYNGYDSELFFPDKVEPHDDSLTIGCVSNFQPLKDIPTLIRAFRLLLDKVPQARLRLIGSGETKASCQELARKLGVSKKISFENEVDHLELPAFYRSLDVFVLPSRSEGFCCSYIEAMGCGVPVFGCKVSSLAEAFADEDCSRWLADSGDSLGLSQLILNWYNMRRPFRLRRPFDTATLAQEFLARIVPLRDKEG